MQNMQNMQNMQEYADYAKYAEYAEHAEFVEYAEYEKYAKFANQTKHTKPNQTYIFGHLGPNIGLSDPFDAMPDQKTMRTRCLIGFLIFGYQNFCSLLK